MKKLTLAGCIVIGAVVWFATPGFPTGTPQAPLSGMPPVDYSLGPDSG